MKRSILMVFILAGLTMSSLNGFSNNQNQKQGTTQKQYSFGNLMVIVGSFKTLDEANKAQKQFMTGYKLETEVLSTNKFQNLEKDMKDMYIVVTGRGLNTDEAAQLMENLKSMKIKGYIKDAGEMKMK